MTISQIEQQLIKTMDLLRGTMDPSEYGVYIFSLLLFKRISDVYDETYEREHVKSGSDANSDEGSLSRQFQVPEGCRWKDVQGTNGDLGVALENALRGIEQENPEILGNIFSDVNWSNTRILPDEILTNLLLEFSQLDLSYSSINSKMLGQVFEQLIMKISIAEGKRGGGYYTPHSIVQLVSSLIEAKPGESIYDPACGSGGLLIGCINPSPDDQQKKGEHLRLFGQEINTTTTRLACMNMIIHGVEEFQVESADTLTNPIFLDNDNLRTFDCVVSNPPFSVKNWGYEFWENDPFFRNSIGIPPKSRSDFAWVQHMIHSIDGENGRMAVVLPLGVLFRGGSEERIRKALIEQDLMDTIISLPNMLTSTAIPVCILILKKKRSLERKGKVLFINADTGFEKRGKQNTLRPEDIKHISETYRSYATNDGYSRVVSHEEIEALSYNLNISRYVDNSELASLIAQFDDKFTKHTLKDLSVEINYSRGQDFTETPNTVYIRRIGIKKDKLTSVKQISEDHNHYLQVVLEKTVYNEYVAQFLGSSIGQQALSAILWDGSTERIEKDGLKECFIALPSPEVQKENVSTHQKLEKLKSTIESIDQELSLNPTDYIEFQEQIDSMLKIIGKLSEADRIRGLIRQGETKKVEFKQSLSLDVKTQTKEVYIETATLKTIVAFINSEGGTLLVGVADDERIVGVNEEINKFHRNSMDNLLKHFKNRIKHRIGEEFYPYIDFHVSDISSCKVLVVECDKSGSPCFLDKKDFYVRTTPATDKLEGKKMMEYCQNHFKNNL